MNKPKRLMIIAGGTGGHIFPGLTIAHYFKNHGWKINWLGTNNRMEVDLVPKYGIKIDFIKISYLRGKGIKSLLLLLQIIQAIKSAKKIIQYYQPNVVLGMGGYVSAPGCIAAWLCNIPFIIHEQNSIAGLTNRWLSKIATHVLQAFPNTLPNAILVGNPIRQNLLTIPMPEKRLINRKGVLRVLVIGGSQGAEFLNHNLPKVASELYKKAFFLHQSGKNFQKSTKKTYQNLCISNNYKVIEFIHNMVYAYSWADIIICRSGALTVSEIITIGLPAIFIPFEHKDRQQYLNAIILEKIGAAKILEQSKFTVKLLINLLNKWSRVELLEMAQKARIMSLPNSTIRIADILMKVIK